MLPLTPKDRPWLNFLIYTFGITWVIGIALFFPLKGVENVLGLSENSISNIVAKYGPSLGGLLTAYLLYGIKGLKRLLKKGVKWKVPFSNYVLALTLPFLTKIHIFWALDHNVALNANLDSATFNAIMLAFLTHLFLGGGFGEEFGWRGFMLPQLNKRYPLLKTSIVIGMFWTIWHLPAYVLGNQGEQEPLLPFFLAVIAVSIVMSWLYYRAKESILILAIFHAMINASGKIIALLSTIERSEIQNGTFFWGEAIILILIACTLLIFNWKKFGLPDKESSS